MAGHDFAQFLVEEKVLKFGDFILKSGKRSPYFLNFGAVASGRALFKLGQFFADKIVLEIGVKNFDVLLGPAYKGIPLAIATATALYHKYEIDLPVLYNRKEAKTHGEGQDQKSSMFIGAQLKGNERLLLIDDVLTTGGTKVEVIDAVKAQFPAARFSGVVIAVDRKEKLDTGETLAEHFCKSSGMQLWAIADIHSIALQLNLPLSHFSTTA